MPPSAATTSPAPAAIRFQRSEPSPRAAGWLGGERRREESEACAGTAGAGHLARVVRRAGHHATARAQRRGPAAGAQVNAGAQGTRQPHIARDHQDQAPGPADPRQIAPERRAGRIIVVAQHDAGQAPWQPGSRRARIRQAPRIGEQPQYRLPRAAA